MPRNNNNRQNRNNERRNQDTRPTKFYKSKNMHYVFHHEYFNYAEDVSISTRGNVENLNSLIRKGILGEKVDRDFENIYKSRNYQLSQFNFDTKLTPVLTWRDADDKPLISGYEGIRLKTIYPGLLVGTGDPHGFSARGTYQATLSFDYVTGLPYVPGSSLKGVLRSAFPLTPEEIRSIKNIDQESFKEENEGKANYIKDLLGWEDTSKLIELRNIIFNEYELKDLEGHENIHQPNDVFLGAFPIEKNGSNLIENEYITPHGNNPFKNPIPIPLIKVKPNVVFEFGFILKDTSLSNGTKVTVGEKLKLFSQILQDFGVGAKTNVGFGQLVAVD